MKKIEKLHKFLIEEEKTEIILFSIEKELLLKCISFWFIISTLK